MEDNSKKHIKSSRIPCLITEFVNSDPSKYKDSCFIGILDVAQDISLKEISDLVFNEVIKQTGSNYCYVAYVDPKNKYSVGISFSHLTDDCKMYAEIGEARFKVLNDGSYGGLLGYSLDTGESFYTHNIGSHPSAHGLPPGHGPVDQFLSVPVKYKGEILGQIVAANPKEDYNDVHLDIVEKIADFYAFLLKEMLY